MLSKQDRQGARTPADVERRYGQKFSDVLGIAEESRETAQQAQEEVKTLDESLDQDGVFNRLTNNGKAQGIYRDANGNILINADFIKSGKLTGIVIVAENESGDYVQIYDGRILSGNKDTPYFALYPLYGGGGAWALTFNNNLDTGERVSGTMTYDVLELGAVNQDPAPFKVTASGHYYDPTVRIMIPRSDAHFGDTMKELYAYWKPNGDGSYSIVGYENSIAITTEEE